MRFGHLICCSFSTMCLFSLVAAKKRRSKQQKTSFAHTKAIANRFIGTEHIVKWRAFHAKFVHKLYCEQCRRRCATVKMKIDFFPIFSTHLPKFSYSLFWWRKRPKKSVGFCFKQMYSCYDWISQSICSYFYGVVTNRRLSTRKKVKWFYPTKWSELT